jgi:hypothetical protein
MALVLLGEHAGGNQDAGVVNAMVDSPGMVGTQ